MPKKKLYIPSQKEKFTISRTNIQSYLECQKCFYLNLVKGIKHPPGFPLALNMAIDSILKKEFDFYREAKKPHPNFNEKINNSLFPYSGDEFYDWRKSAKIFHKETNFEVLGKFDDIWSNEDQSKLYLADYKSGTINAEGTNTLNQSYKNQMDIYFWIAKQLDSRFENKSFFYYQKLKKENSMSDSKFITFILEYNADDHWVEKTLVDIKKLLDSKSIPNQNDNCAYCKYVDEIKEKS